MSLTGSRSSIRSTLRSPCTITPFLYPSEKDILKLVHDADRKYEGGRKNHGEISGSRQKSCCTAALIGYIYYEAPEEEQNFSTLIEMHKSVWKFGRMTRNIKMPLTELFDELNPEIRATLPSGSIRNISWLPV